MVSPHPGWEDRHDGFTPASKPREAGDSEPIRIAVKPVVAEFNEHTAMVWGVERGSENAYSVVVFRGHSEQKHHDEIITFGTERSAWEFAHLLTHYFASIGDPAIALADLLSGGRRRPANDQWLPHRVVDDLSATEAFEKLLSPSPPPDAMSDVLG